MDGHGRPWTTRCVWPTAAHSRPQPLGQLDASCPQAREARRRGTGSTSRGPAAANVSDTEGAVSADPVRVHVVPDRENVAPVGARRAPARVSLPPVRGSFYSDIVGHLGADAPGRRSATVQKSFGPWSASETCRRAWGTVVASLASVNHIPVRDYHLPVRVSKRQVRVRKIPVRVESLPVRVAPAPGPSDRAVGPRS